MSATEEQLSARLRAGLGELGQPRPDGDVERLIRLVTELERWNRRMNLTAIREPERMVSLHLLDSLAVLPLLAGPRVIDVGTGAGFPGLPLAVATPDFDYVLLDSSQRKIGFVRHMIGELGLANAEAVHARAEDYAPATGFDTVIARALASLPRLVDLGGHLVREGGQLLALKGQYPAEELDPIEMSSEWQHEVVEVAVPGLPGHARHAIRLRRR